MENEVIETIIDLELSAPQGEVMDSRAAVTLQMAGQGGGKTQLIGYLSGGFVENMPEVKQFIGANTYLQLSQSTLTNVFKTWKAIYDFTEYDSKGNTGGSYVVDKKPPLHFTTFHQFRDYSGIISFWNGAVIFIGSLDNYKAHEGKEFGIAHLDETKDTKESALKEVILGRLRQYGIWFDRENEVYFDNTISAEEAEARGWTAWNPLYIHTSPALGGTPWLNAMFKLETWEKEIKAAVLLEEKGFFFRRFENKCVVIYSTHHNQKNLPPNYIENQKKNQTEEAIMRLVYAVPFGKTGGEYFPRFSKFHHVKPTPYLPGLEVLQCWDFNVVPFMTLICIQLEEVTKYIDEFGVKSLEPRLGTRPIQVLVIRIYREYCLEPPMATTEDCCEHFKADHPVGTTEISYYGDAHGLTRIPGLGSLTNFKIVSEKMEDYVHNFSKKVKAPNVGINHRRDLLNRIFEGKIPELEIQIDEACERTIEDFEGVKLGPKGKVKTRVKDEATGENIEKYGHPTDAVEYCVSEVCKEYIR